MSEEKLRIRDFYSGRSVLITGATGFIGKVLIEKLLRSVPEIEKVYIIIRPKRGNTIEQRINAITNTQLFEKLKKLHPGVIQNKLKAIAGDVCQLGLGLSEDDRKLITENVSVIFHGAASVRFDDPLKYAVLINTRGAREVATLALETKKLVAFLHISTTYCNIDKPVVGEQIYPAPADWRKTIEIVEKTDENTLNILTEKYIAKLPNTYTFSKSLAEHVIYDTCKNRVPVVVYRPSIVISSMHDPIPGWIDNFNGPVALMVGSGKGILRTFYADPNLISDYIPVDITVKALLLAAWQKGITSNTKDKLDVTFYNGSNNHMHPLSVKEVIDLGTQLIWEVPLSNILWFPGGSVTFNKVWYYINFVFCQLLPAIAVDGILRLMHKKPMLVKIQRRIYIANMALQVFLTNQWSFLNNNTLKLKDTLLPEEREDFGFDTENVDVFGYFRNALIQGRKYLLKEDESTIPNAKVNLYRMYILDRTVKLICYLFVLWILIFKMRVISYASSIIHSILDMLFTWD